MIARTLVTEPAVEPITQEEAELHLRYTEDADEELISDLILAARRFVEKRTWRALITQTWDFDWDRFPTGNGCISVPLPPLQSVTSITYVDPDGDSQTLASSKYNVLTSEEPGLIEPAYNETWPTTRDQKHAVTVRAVCGYGALGTTVPYTLRQAMLLLIGHWFENRESVVVGTINAELKQAVDDLIDVEHARAMVA